MGQRHHCFAFLDNTYPFIHGCCHISAIQKLSSSTKPKYLLSAPLLKSMISVLQNGIYKINKFILLMPPVHIVLSIIKSNLECSCDTHTEKFSYQN